ncbi:uncharacterized protein LOC114304071 isoform X1 [Camellia sinensis]|uniref:uncharacterized protein LOC114304071 isoform X1 n=1 Tax=Camellia sinensis TaxID=4442 RepID=UPI00103638C9|nr:uncharacterized protein LOC114304071 isoform X1 [Camellia sinensis]
MAKVTNIWGLQGNLEVLDIGHGFFIVKFDIIEDYTKVITGKPWVALDHFVTVKRWQQDFKSDKVEKDTTAMWVRFPNLPIEYYNEKVLLHMAKVLGTPLKIDINTAMVARRGYARVYVKIDLRKPLISQIAIGRDEDIVPLLPGTVHCEPSEIDTRAGLRFTCLPSHLGYASVWRP